MGRYTPTNNAYVYVHKRLDKNCIFYVGIGSSSNHKRAYQTDKRNDYWTRIYNLTDIEVEVLFEGLTWEVANYYEKYLIATYGRVNKGTGTLVNMTDGGDGVRGWVITEDGRKRMSNAKKGFRPTEESKLKNKIWHSIPIIQMTREGEFIREWGSTIDAARELDYKSPSKITECCKGKRKTHKNFTWKYKNN
jgi:hypothetical protein